MKRRLRTVLFAAALVGLLPRPYVFGDADKSGLPEKAVSIEHLFEFFEYETIVLSSFTDPRDISPPNWRELYLKKAERYEKFLLKYPNSQLSAEVKLRMAELYKDVERKEVYPFRLELYRCLAERSDENGGTFEDRKNCIGQFYKNIGRWRDPVYVQKAVSLLLELVRDYGHVKRYSMEEPRVGGFKWVDEEIGAQALYLLSKGADPKNRKSILLLILREYKAGPKLISEINDDLEKLKN